MAEQILKSKVTAVTVYPDRAQIKASATCQVANGASRLVFDELPIDLAIESVRAAGRGEARVRILGVDVRRIHYEKTPSEQALKLTDQMDEISELIQSAEDEKSTQKAQLDYIDGLRAATQQYAKGIARGKSTVDRLEALQGYFFDTDARLRQEMRLVDKRKVDLERQRDLVRRQLLELESSQPKFRYQAIMELEVLSPGSFTAEITYLIRSASWKPLYDMRLSSNDEGQQLAIMSIAEISQKSGQDWEGVELMVSTARPYLSQVKPELEPWYIGPPEVRAGTYLEPRVAAAIPPTAQADLAMAAPAPAPKAARERMVEQDAEFAEAKADVSQFTAVFKIPGGVDIPGDGSTRKVTLGQFSHEPEIGYLTVPKKTEAVYRKIEGNNRGSGPLLPGRANLFVEDEYIGSTQIDYVPLDGEIELFFGVEEEIQVKRELTKRDVDKSLIRDKRQIAFGHKIELTNLLSKTVEVEVQDQIPVSSHEDIKVRLVDVSPQPSEQTNLNIITWQLQLPAGQKEEIKYGYRVDHPRDMRVIGLSSK